ncbi:MAG: CHRD domain-containing protein [Ottowia sp.]|uniref:CHRD domain-containing protein n=1 Tax=Ottowia sp. TaxID=1898956 RepID=UPI0039E5A80C
MLSPTRRGAALVLLAALAGCAAPPPRPAPPAVTQPAPVEPRLKELAAFKAVLSASEAVPPADSPARGELVAVLNRNTGLLQWKLSYSGLTGPVRAAHFHSPAMGGEVAAPVIAIGRNFSSPYEGRALLTPRQRADLLAGQWYVNLRTARFPEGELRGQLIEQR